MNKNRCLKLRNDKHIISNKKRRNFKIRCFHVKENDFCRMQL